MGARKKNSAEKIKEANKAIAFAKLRNVPTSPRKMRLVADMIRGEKVDRAFDLLKFSSKEAAGRMEKLLASAVANWKVKNQSEAIEDLFVNQVYVDSARMLKRLRPAPQGRAHRIRKRSNHVTLVVGHQEKVAKAPQQKAVEAELTNEENK